MVRLRTKPMTAAAAKHTVLMKRNSIRNTASVRTKSALSSARNWGMYCQNRRNSELSRRA